MEGLPNLHDCTRIRVFYNINDCGHLDYQTSSFSLPTRQNVNTHIRMRSLNFLEMSEYIILRGEV